MYKFIVVYNLNILERQNPMLVKRQELSEGTTFLKKKQAVQQ